jgi:hypothetical protein
VVKFLGILAGIVKFWDQIVWLVKTLQKTPQQKYLDLMERMKEEADDFEKTGRPKWE